MKNAKSDFGMEMLIKTLKRTDSGLDDREGKTGSMEPEEPTRTSNHNGAGKRRESTLTDPYDFGYGHRAMQEVKVCGHCGSTESEEKYICTQCGERLPAQTFFQIYQSKHKTCKLCDTVLASYMRFCPHCGTQTGNKDTMQEKTPEI